MKTHRCVTLITNARSSILPSSSKQHSAVEKLQSHTQATAQLLKEAGQTVWAVSHLLYILKAASQDGKKLG